MFEILPIDMLESVNNNIKTTLPKYRILKTKKKKKTFIATFDPLNFPE
jgi:hypothetical protein